MELNDAELEAFLHEALPAERMAEIERALRDDARLVQRLARVAALIDSGAVSIGAVWRRERLTCPTRDQLGGYLLGTLDPSRREYIDWHLQLVGCPFCRANLDDLRRQQSESPERGETRRRKFFQTSVGRLPRTSPKKPPP